MEATNELNDNEIILSFGGQTSFTVDVTKADIDSDKLSQIIGNDIGYTFFMYHEYGVVRNRVTKLDTYQIYACKDGYSICLGSNYDNKKISKSMIDNRYSKLVQDIKDIRASRIKHLSGK